MEKFIELFANLFDETDIKDIENVGTIEELFNTIESKK